MRGIWTALWTPTDEKGILLVDALKAHLNFLLDHGVDGFAVGGSTGQFPYLDLPTRQKLLHLVIEHVGPQRVLINISDINPATVEAFAKSLKELPISSFMLLPPFYFPFSQTDIAHYFIHIAKIVKRPIFLYNFPECTRNKIELETVEKVCREVPCIGIKHSGADFEYLTPLIDLGKKHSFSIFIGSERRLLEGLTLGIDGAIGGLSNAIPELLVTIYKAFQQNNLADAEAATKKIQEIDSLLKQICFPLNISALMEARNLTPGVIKEIISPFTKKAYQELITALRPMISS